MKITLNDGSVKEYQNTKTVLEIARDLSEGLARVACAGEINGEARHQICEEAESQRRDRQ